MTDGRGSAAAAGAPLHERNRYRLRPPDFYALGAQYPRLRPQCVAVGTRLAVRLADWRWVRNGWRAASGAWTTRKSERAWRGTTRMRSGGQLAIGDWRLAVAVLRTDG